MAGGVLMVAGLVISAFVESLDAVLISFGVLSGLGAGLSYSSSVIVVGFNFERRRNLATGFAVSGAGIGTFAMSPLMQLAKNTYGYNGLCLMCGALSFHHLVFGALCRPSELEKMSKAKDSTYKQDEEKRKGRRLLSILKEIMFLFSDISFMFVVVSMTFFSLGVYLMYVHFSKLVITKGTSETDAAYLLSLAGICSGISRLLIGFSSNAENINELMLFSGCFSLLGIAGLLLPLYVGSYVGQAFFAVMLGMYSGCCYPLLNTINVKLVGIEHLALAYGIEMFGAGIGSLIGPPISGLLEFSL
ncbi:hypothetical protein FSP39_020970 [Pinctada imbricata]|uniref:Major facilitator superfamily (MFS) profile domain-containing protein n=1 Tax=Pinctada imbricata TaxID=66713 RepID=A0AA88YI20_PINIB|nr:hypothetical protein FSP39_020970 [Pinctada imbricata]